jgi:hypothetical protein
LGRTWKDTKSVKAIRKPHKKERRDMVKLEEGNKNNSKINSEAYWPKESSWIPGTKLRIEE